MTYPESQYDLQDGMIGAVLKRNEEHPDLITSTGTRVHYLSTTKSTNSAFGLFRWEMGAQPGGAAAHFHRTMSESFYVLSGSVRAFTGDEWLDLQVGDYLYVPPGALHGFRNESGAPATMLIHFAPGAPREEYFEGLDELRLAGVQPGDPQWIEFCSRHDNHLV